MPQVIAAAVAWAVTGIQVAAATIGLTTTVAGSAALGTVATAVLNAAAYAGVSAGLTALSAPKVGGRTGTPEAWKSEANPPLPFPIGRIGTGGYVVYRNTYGPDNRYQGIVTVVGAAGPINAWSTFYMDDVARSQTGERINHPKYNNWAWRQTRLGLQPDTALTSPVGIEGGESGLPGWGVNHKLSGKAAEMLTLRQDADFKYFSQGEPRALRIVQGLLAWDPRLDSTYPGGVGACRLDNPATWVYSTNGGIHALKWALGLRENGILVGGIGASLRAVDVAAFVHVANVADINGWTIGGVPTSADDKYQVIMAMLQAAGAVYVRQNGRISCMARGTPRTSLLTVSKHDLAGPIRLTTGASRIGRINTIIPRCVQEDQKWSMTQLGAVTHASYRTEDGGAVRPRGLDYPYVTDADQCAQLAALDVAKSREGIVGSMPMKPYMRVLKPGDAFTITGPDFVLNDLQVICERRQVDTATSIVTVEFSSETPGAIEWALGQTASPPPTPSLTVPDITAFPEPTDGSWAAVAGTGQPLIVVSGATDNAQTQDLVFEYRLDGEDDDDWKIFTITSGTTTRAELTGLEAYTAYEVAVSYRSIWGVTGGRLVLGPITTGASSATAAGEVPWTGVSDPTGTRPQDNADVTGENTAADTANVGGRPTGVLVGQVDQATADVEELFEVFDHTEAAAASAAAADAARVLTQGARDVAIAKATEAGGYATVTIDKAAEATGAAGTATAQALVANSAAAAARSVATQLLPDRPAIKADFYEAYNTTYASPDDTPSLPWGTVATVAGEGHVLAGTEHAKWMVTRGWLPVTADQSYRFEVRGRVTADSAAPGNQKLYIGLACYDASGVHLGLSAWYPRDEYWQAADGWATHSETVTSAQIAADAVALSFPAPVARVRLMVGAYSSTAQNFQYEFAFSRLRNITSTAQAEAAANAAATQAAAAETFADDSGVYAAKAASSASVAASVSTGSLLKNPNFNDYPTPTGAPNGWQHWSGNSFTRVAGETAPYALRMSDPGGNNVGLQQATAVGSLKPGDWLVAEIDVKLVSGSLVGSGMYVAYYKADGTSAGWDEFIRLSSTPDGSTVAPGAGVAGQTYRFRKLINVGGTATSYALVYPMAHWSGHGSIAAATDQVWYRASVRAADDQEIAARQASTDITALYAETSSQSLVLADLETKTATAYWEQALNAGSGAEAFVRAIAIQSPGVTTSNVGIGAVSIDMLNLVDDEWRPTLRMVGGNAEFTGGLKVGTYVRLGTGAGWAVALQAKDFQVSDGDTVSFGADLGAIPQIAFGSNNLAPLSSGETYNLYADSLTTTGFIARLKINTPGTPSSYTLTTDTSPGSGPTRQIDKASNPDASGGSYTLACTGTVTVRYRDVPSGDFVELGGSITIDVYGKVGGVWGIVGQMTAFVTDNIPGGGTHSYFNVPISYSVTDTLTFPSSLQAFGISVNSYVGYAASLGDFVSASWTAPGTGSGTRSATPSGQKATVTVRPKN